MRFTLVLLSLLLLSDSCKAATIDVRLVIQQGLFALVDGNTLECLTYSTSESFHQSSDILVWNNGDIVNLRVVNFDDELHGFTLDNITDFGVIPVGDSVEQQITLNQVGVFRYFDPLNSPYNEYLGLNGLVHIKDPSDAATYFYWDLRELEQSWNALILAGGNPNLLDYKPNYFTINGNSNPDINNDPVARVVGNVNNEFRIVIVNNGLSIHSVHFHGYHLFSIEDSRNPGFIGREKDTFPIYPKEHFVLKCVPDKPGEYPVHDHNLVAVTGGDVYGSGMFTTLLIAP